MAIVIRYMCCLVFISRSSDLIQYGGIVTKANMQVGVGLLCLHVAMGSTMHAVLWVNAVVLRGFEANFMAGCTSDANQ